MAIGAMPEMKVINNLQIKINNNGYIVVDENYKTSSNNVFAGGDIIGTKSTVAWAAKTGRDARRSNCKIFKCLIIFFWDNNLVA